MVEIQSYDLACRQTVGQLLETCMVDVEPRTLSCPRGKEDGVINDNVTLFVISPSNAVFSAMAVSSVDPPVHEGLWCVFRRGQGSGPGLGSGYGQR